jgi:hypothetical protein
MHAGRCEPLPPFVLGGRARSDGRSFISGRSLGWRAVGQVPVGTDAARPDRDNARFRMDQAIRVAAEETRPHFGAATVAGFGDHPGVIVTDARARSVPRLTTVSDGLKFAKIKQQEIKHGTAQSCLRLRQRPRPARRGACWKCAGPQPRRRQSKFPTAAPA